MANLIKPLGNIIAAMPSLESELQCADDQQAQQTEDGYRDQCLNKGKAAIARRRIGVMLLH
jgi:hypothetical protein